MLTLAGVAGWPVRHSRSPAMMAAAFRELGLDWRYVQLPLPAERFEDAVRALPRSGFVGINVTVPYKLAALAVADEASDAARSIGAANTLSFENGAIVADNTDAAGFLAALGDDPVGRSALVLGAGGAARAVVWALREAGAEVSVWNRTAERAAALADELGVAHAHAPGGADLVINSTSVGLDPTASEAEVLAALGLAGADPPEVLADLVYGEAPTRLEEWARAGGSRVVSGLDMLVHQGALSLERWSGRAAPVDAMRAGAGAQEQDQG